MDSRHQPQENFHAEGLVNTNSFRYAPCFAEGQTENEESQEDRNTSLAMGGKDLTALSCSLFP